MAVSTVVFNGQNRDLCRPPSPHPHVVPYHTSQNVIIVDLTEALAKCTMSNIPAAAQTQLKLSSGPSAMQAKCAQPSVSAPAPTDRPPVESVIHIDGKLVRLHQAPEYPEIRFVNVKHFKISQETQGAIKIKAYFYNGEKEICFINLKDSESCREHDYLAKAQAPLFSSASTLVSKINNESKIPLTQLCRYADGLNIEGATIAKDFLRPEQIYANLCFVIDTPLSTDGHELCALTLDREKAGYPLKESIEPKYNEPRATLVYALVMHYYITQGHRIVNKNKNEVLKMMVFVHRNSTGPDVVKHLFAVLETCYPEMKVKKEDKGNPNCECERLRLTYSELNVEIGFYSGDYTKLFKKRNSAQYVDLDIVLTLSMISGLNTKWEAGSMAIPSKWIPYYLEQQTVQVDKWYSTNNHLINALKEVIEGQTEQLIQTINEKFRSPNVSKKEIVTAGVTANDFHTGCTLLQVDGLFNPSKLKENSVIISGLESLRGSSDRMSPFLCSSN